MGGQFQKEKKDMKCIHCKGKMKRKTAPFQIDRKGYHLIFDAIPAWVCGQCGEVYFEEAEVQAIQNLLRKLDEDTKKLAFAG
jgi:YgiT-type zinc finger domain-containing protein